jgi:hypothetical protein
MRRLELLDAAPRQKLAFPGYVGLHAMDTLAPASKAAQPTFEERIAVLDEVLEELFRQCVCSAMLPPCPDPVDRDCVPIATVTVQRGTCVVTEVCNWKAREFAITLPNLHYWLSWLPWGRLKESLARMCCTPSRANANLGALTTVLGKASLAQNLTLMSALQKNMMFGAAPKAASTVSPDAAAGLGQGADRALGFDPRSMELGPVLALASRALSPDSMADWLLQLADAPGKDTPAPAATAVEVKALHERVAELERRLAAAPAAAPKAPAGKPARKRR